MEEKEKKSTTVKIKITEKTGWTLAGVAHYNNGQVVDVDLSIYNSIKHIVKHEVVK